MTIRERVNAVVEGKRPDRMPWVGDLSHWHMVHEKRGTLPERYVGMDLLDLHKALAVGIKEGAPFFRAEYRNVEVVTTSEEHDGNTITTSTMKTPQGDLRTVTSKTPIAESWHTVEHPVKSIDDFKVYEYVMRDRVLVPTPQDYEETSALIGEQGICHLSHTGLGWSPLQQVMVDLMGQEQGIYALHDHPRETERFMGFLDECQDEVAELACASEATYAWVGNHVDALLVNPTMFQRYLMPFYNKRTDQLHRHGKICMAHYDGRLRGLFPMLKNTGLDIVEAVTPLPMGDISMEEIKRDKGELVIWGGMCASLFCDPYTSEDVRRHLARWIDTVGDRGIVGIGDQIPPDGDIEKVRLISELVESQDTL